MGQDYTARKSAKKQRKRVRLEGGSGGDTRQRKKKNQPRRQCRGICFKDPALSAEDRAGGWGDGSDDEGVRGAAVDAGRRACAADEAWAGGAAQQAVQQPQKQGRRASAPGAASAAGGAGAGEAGQGRAVKRARLDPQHTQMSTGVRLLDPAAAAATLPTKRAKGDGQGSVPEALQAYDPLIQAAMVALGHVEATPVQQATWLPACSGQDVQVVAEPGSGKTLAYLLPGMAGIAGPSGSPDAPVGVALPRAPAPRLLVLAPTRELAQQVLGQCKAAGRALGLRAACVHGGSDRAAQVASLVRAPPQVLVATPGRLLDLVDTGDVSLTSVVYVVLDECDKMLGLGFRPQLQRLHAMLLPPPAPLAAPTAAADKQRGKRGGGGAATSAAGPGAATSSAGPGAATSSAGPGAATSAAGPGAATSAAGPGAATSAAGPGAPGGGSGGSGSRPQVLLVTATLPPEVTASAEEWLARGAASARTAPGAASISATITQVVHVCAEHKKPAKLLKHLAAIKDKSQGLRNPPRIIIFTNRIKTARFVHQTVVEAGFRATLLHGGRSQPERNEAMASFRSGKVQVLVATDVAARGLDVRGLPYVVNYDFPSRLEAYVHRVGRTGRLAAHGHAYSFFTRNLAKLAPDLVALLRAHSQAIDPNLLQLAEAWREVGRMLAAQGGGADGGGGGDSGALDAEPEEVEEEGGGLHLQQHGLVAEDLMEGLPGGAVAAPAPAAGDQRRSGLAEVGALHASTKRARRSGGSGGAEDAVLVPRGPAAAVTAGAAGAGALAESSGEPEFVPSVRFAGARQGYVFKAGRRGLGYYLDAAAPVAGARKQGSHVHTAEHPQQGKQQLVKQQQGKQKHSKQQQGKHQQGKQQHGQVRVLHAHSGGDELGSQQRVHEQQQTDDPSSALIAGLIGRAFGGSGGSKTANGGGSHDSSSSDEEGASAGGLVKRLAGTGKKKPLPGRLRKKLSKLKASGKAN